MQQTPEQFAEHIINNINSDENFLCNNLESFEKKINVFSPDGGGAFLHRSLNISIGSNKRRTLNYIRLTIIAFLIVIPEKDWEVLIKSNPNY